MNEISLGLIKRTTKQKERPKKVKIAERKRNRDK